MFEKDDEASKKSKQVRYQIGEILKTLRRYIDTIKNEKMTDEEKVESIKLYISQKLKEYIQKYEDEHGDVIDDDTVIRISEYILNFIQPMLYKEISKV